MIGYDHPFVPTATVALRARSTTGRCSDPGLVAGAVICRSLTSSCAAPAQYSRAYQYRDHADDNDVTHFLLHQLDIMRAGPSNDCSMMIVQNQAFRNAAMMDARAATARESRLNQRTAARHPGGTLASNRPNRGTSPSRVSSRTSTASRIGPSRTPTWQDLVPNAATSSNGNGSGKKIRQFRAAPRSPGSPRRVVCGVEGMIDGVEDEPDWIASVAEAALGDAASAHGSTHACQRRSSCDSDGRSVRPLRGTAFRSIPQGGPKPRSIPSFPHPQQTHGNRSLTPASTQIRPLRTHGRWVDSDRAGGSKSGPEIPAGGQ